MKKMLVLVLILMSLCACAAAQGQGDLWQYYKNSNAPTKPAEHQPIQPLINNSIVKLVKAGIDESTIVTMIKTQPGKYSLGVNEVIALKKAGVSDKIISAMAMKPAGSPNLAGSPSVNVRAIPNEAGLYTIDGSGHLEHIVGRVTSFDRSGSLLASELTAGIHASRINTQIPGQHARVTVGPDPVFYFRTPGSRDVAGLDLVLTRMTVKGDRRQFEVGARGLMRGSNGVSVRHQIDYEVSEIAPGLYKLTPSHELEQGQYAFYMLRGIEHKSTSEGQGFVFDFQVE